MIFPNVPCVVYPFNGTDMYGQRSFAVSRREKCVVIRLERQEMHSTVRADQSATKGTAQEELDLVRFLFPTTSKTNVDDVVEVEGAKFLVRSRSSEYDAFGQLDHYRMECAAWR